MHFYFKISVYIFINSKLYHPKKDMNNDFKKMKKSIKFADNVIVKSGDGLLVDKATKSSDTSSPRKSKSNWNVHNFRQARPSIVQLEDSVYLPNEVVNVELRLIILKLGNISTLESRFSCEAFMEASWYDKTLAKYVNNESLGIKYDEKKHWNPLLYVQNIVNHQSQEIWYSVEETTKGY